MKLIPLCLVVFYTGNEKWMAAGYVKMNEKELL